MMKSNRNARRRGVSLMEVIVVITILGVLAGMTVPTYRRAIEQTRIDLAAAQLRSIWAAQRVYYLENRSYTNDLTVLGSSGLIDTSSLAADTYYYYSLTSTGSSFAATASRSGSTSYTGTISIDESGVVTGHVSGADGSTLTPGFQ